MCLAILAIHLIYNGGIRDDLYLLPFQVHAERIAKLVVEDTAIVVESCQTKFERFHL